MFEIFETASVHSTVYGRGCSKKNNQKWGPLPRIIEDISAGGGVKIGSYGDFLVRGGSIG